MNHQPLIPSSRSYLARYSSRKRSLRWCLGTGLVALLTTLGAPTSGQTLLNIDFGVGSSSAKTGFAATGMGTNDYWNLYRQYEPKFVPGMPLVANGKLEKLKRGDGSESGVSVCVTNAPGVWGNSSGDPMYDTYIFSQNGSNITVVLRGLAPGRYHFYLYGHGDADVSGEQNSIFTLRSGTNTLGPIAQTGGSGWKASNPWQERAQYVVFRDVPVEDAPVFIDVAPGPNGIAVLNGLQILSRGTSPPRLVATTPPEVGPAVTNLLFHEIRYEGKISDNEARFAVNCTVESLSTNEISGPLFEGDVALVGPQLPSGLRIVSHGRQTRLFCARPGVHQLSLEVVAHISRAEPWNQVSFNGPPAAIAAVTARASTGVELQLVSGTQLSGSNSTGDSSQVQGFLGADRTLALRWQSKGAEVRRKSLITVDTAATAQVTPTVVKFVTTLRFEILQAPVPSLRVEVPSGQVLTKLQGEQIRDWQVKSEGERQVLEVQFIKAVEKTCTMGLYTEQALETTPEKAVLLVPQPLEVQRESGSFTLTADDTVVELDSASGLRQVNAPAGSVAAYRFNTRPIAVAARISRIEPVLTVSDRATARLEDTRLLVSHALLLNVEKAGIYSLELMPQTNFSVTEVKGEGIDDWNVSGGKLKLSFSSRVLGSRKVTVQLERANKTFPETLRLEPLLVAGATNVSTRLGAASSPGIRLKTAELTGMREIPVDSLPERSDELLGYASEQAQWAVQLSAERLPPRVVAEVFNLVTIGDGLVGGSATLRYGILNQGVQQLRIQVPPHWKNIEFTGANIRRKDQQTNVWTLTLQDKVWGGYTLVLTYDYQFDPKGATLDLAGAHALDVERETGSLGLMTAASLKVTPAAPAEPLRRVDEAELSESDRALCTRPLLLVYKYTGSDYHHSVQVMRFEEVPVLEAVADRTELTTVLTDEGQLLTQSSFMVKNNEKQFQRFKLPKNSEFWSSYVNGQPAKPERDGDWFLVPLPRDANRDQAFAVDIVYAQKVDLKRSLLGHRVELQAPLTDIPNTYAEWQLFAPTSQRLSSFGGNMTAAAGTTYTFNDAWQQFLAFYGNVIENYFGTLLFCSLAAFVVFLVVMGVRRGAGGVLVVLLAVSILAILAAMMLPALGRAKARAQRISALNNLKQIGVAAKTWALDHGERYPENFETMSNELSTDKVTYDPNTGQRFIYIGTGKDESHPEAILAYSPSDVNGRAVLFADGSVQVLSQDKFEAAMQRDAAVPRTVIVANVPQVIAAPPNAAPATEAAATAAGTEVKRMELTPGQAIAGGGGFGGGVPARATATGIKPIRIEIPRSGQVFTFTKVLNAGREPLTVDLSLVRLKVYRTLQMVAQVCTFAFGLLLFWAVALSARRSSFWMAVALLLVLWSVASLLAMWRLLHLGLIVAVPGVPLGLCIWFASKAWERRKARHTALPPEMPSSTPPGSASAPASAAGLLVAAALFTSMLPARADELPTASPDTVSIVSASYSGAVSDKVARFEVRLQLLTSATNQVVPLFGPEVALESFTASADVRLVRDEHGLGLLVPGRTNVDVQLKLVAKLGGDVSRRQLAFAVPAALASQVDVNIEEPDAEVEFPSAVAFTRESGEQRTHVQATLGSAGRLELNWTPRVKRAAEIAATVFVQNTSLVTIGGGVVNTRCTLEYQVSQGELKQLQVRIPAEQRVLRVEGESVRLWEVNGDVLNVELLKGVAPAYKLLLETEAQLDKLPASVKVGLPHALDVKRETGLVALRTSEEVSLTLESTTDLQRVDAEEYTRAAADKPEGIQSAFRFLKPEFSLLLRVETVQPQLEAVVHNHVRVGAESQELSSQVDFMIKRAGLFTLRVALPPAYRLDRINGANIAQWVERNETVGRVLEVSLKERTLGVYKLELVLTRTYQETPRSVVIAGVHPLGTEKLSGFITVAAELGLAVKTESIEGLTEIPYATVATANPQETVVPGQTSGLAFKFVTAQPSNSPTWQLSVATETVEPWIRAELMNAVTITETLVSGRTQIKYTIANAPVKEFRIRVPSTYKNVELTGAQIRRRDQTNDEWRVELQGKVRGEYFLLVTWELPKSAGTNVVELSGIEAVGTERETGFIGVNARSPLQVAERAATALLNKIDVSELPEWAAKAEGPTVLAYRYLRPGWKLALEANRFSEAEVLQALIDNARLTTVVADDGQVMTEMALSIRNNGRQHLEIELPAGATLWSAFVSGEPVRPSKREGKLLLPLTRDAASDTPVPVELTFIGSEPFPKRKGSLALVSPRFDVPLKNARWDLYLPPDYEYSQFTGSMSRTSEAGMPEVQVYSLSEYKEQQRVQTAQEESEVKYGLSLAKEKLSSGNLREAMSSFSRAKSRGRQLAEAGERAKDLKQIEDDVRKAQSSNLIGAQNRYLLDNAGRLGDQQVQMLAQQPAVTGALSQQQIQAGRLGVQFLNNDIEVAGLQWDKLEKAQQVALVKVAPLRVNLPTRGVHLAFAQVLQTELRKPISIQLRVENTKVPSWTGRAAVVVLGFCLLWGIVAMVNATASKSTTSAP